MFYQVIIIGVVFLILCFGMYRSNKLLKQKKKLETGIKCVYESVDILGDVIYQGGYPPMPKPAHLKIGLTGSYMVLFDKKGASGRIEYDRLRKIDKFTVSKPNTKRYSLMAWGPLAIYFNQPTYQHFIVVSYVDIDNDYNNIVFQIPNEEIRNQYFESIQRYYKPMQILRAKAGGTASSAVTSRILSSH